MHNSTKSRKVHCVESGSSVSFSLNENTEKNNLNSSEKK